MDLDLQIEMIIFDSLLTTFKERMKNRTENKENWLRLNSAVASQNGARGEVFLTIKI